MSNNEPAGPTPAKAAAAATQEGALPMGRLTLIGLFGPDTDLTALVRLSGGRIRKVRRGQRLGDGRVAGIDADGLVLQSGDRTRRLTLPGG